MEIEDQILEIPSEGFENQLRGKSKRLQSIKACDMSLDEFLLSISNKKNLNFVIKLIEFRDLALQGFPNETLDLFSSLFKTFMSNPNEIIEENPIKTEEIKKPLSELKQKEEKALKKASNEDFLHFLSLTNCQKYPSFRIFQMVSGSRRSSSEEIRKMLMKTIESMKLESLMIGFIEFLKENDHVITMEDSKSLMEITILILKILIEIIAFFSSQ